MSKKKNIGKVPEGYFDQLKHQLKQNIHVLEDELKVNAPTLYKLGKNEGYLVPEEYFKNYSFELPKKKKSNFRIVRLSLSIAASLMLMVSAFFMLNSNRGQEIQFLASLNDAEVYDYLIDNVSELDEDLVFELAELNLDEMMQSDEIEIDFLIENASDLDLYDLEDL